MTNYTFDGTGNQSIDDMDGGLDLLQFDVSFSTFLPTEDNPSFVTGATWTGANLTFTVGEGMSATTVTIVDQLNAGQIESLSMGPTAPFVYNFAGKGDGGGGDDWIVRDLGGTSRGKAGDDIMFGSADNDTLLGGAGFDIILGFGGDDTIKGGSGRLNAAGGEGNDKIIGGSDGDSLYGGLDNDVLRGNGGRDGLYGGSGDDKLYGGADSDLLAGGDGDDRLFGGAGEDFMIGGAGANRLNGGADGDSFRFIDATYSGVDTVLDFNTAEGDYLIISALTANFDTQSDVLSEWVRFTDNGTHSWLEVDGDGGGDNFERVAKINNTTGLSVTGMIQDGDLII